MLDPQKKIENLQTVELTNIIRSLLHFIVIDGKNHIDKNINKEKYIKNYLYILSKSINGDSSIVNMKVIHDQIEEDLNLIFKN